MKIELFNNQYANILSFTASSNVKMQKLAKKLENKKDIYMKKPLPVSDIYTNSVDYLKGYLKKEEYIKKLNNSIQQIYNSQNSVNSTGKKINLTEKEEAFFDNMFITFDSIENKNNISKEQIAENLSILV